MKRIKKLSNSKARSTLLRESNVQPKSRTSLFYKKKNHVKNTENELIMMVQIKGSRSEWNEGRNERR